MVTLASYLILICRNKLSAVLWSERGGNGSVTEGGPRVWREAVHSHQQL